MKPPIETESDHTEQQPMHGPKLGELELCVGSPVQTRKGLLYAAVGLGLLLTVYPLLAMLNQTGTSESHGTIEWVGAVLAILAGLAMVSRFHVQGNRLHLFIGLAFLVNGTEDFAHGILSMAGTRWLSAESLSHFIPATYVTGRLLCGALLVLAPFARRLFGTSESPRREMVWVSGITVLAMLVLTTLASLLPLPLLTRPEWFISRPVDLLAGMVFLAAFVISVREYRRNGYALYWWLLLAIGASVYGQLAMSVSKSLYDIPFEAAHVYKLIGYFLPLLGFCLIETNLVEHRRRLQEVADSLQVSEEHYRILFESSRDALMTLAPPSWKFTSGNPAAVKLFGTKDAAEFTALGPWELSPERQPDGHPSAEKAKEMIETAMREGSHLFEWTHKRLSGEDFPASVLLTRMELAGQTLLQATVRDITAQKRAEEALRQARDRAQNYLDIAGVVLVALDTEGAVTLINHKGCALLGCREEEALGKNWFETFLPERCRDRVRGIFAALMAGNLEAAEYAENEVHSLGGEERIIAWHNTHLRDASGRITGTLSSGEDITERRQAEDAAAKENAKLSAMISGMEEGVVFADADNVIIEVNDYLCRFAGKTRETVLGKRIEDIHSGAVLEHILGLIDGFRANPESEPFILQRPLGEAEVMLRMQPIYRAGWYDGVLLNVVNVTELVRARQAVEEANRKLEELATTDPVTGLANRRRFLEVLEAEFQRSRRYGGRLALAMVDVDRFKSFNDAHGHAFGDRVLVETAKRLVAGARQTDVVARLGGDEFVILMPETSADEAVQAAERIRKAVSKNPISDGKQSVPATISVGIGTVQNGKAGTPESLLKQADGAMYAAKEAGRNRVCLAPSEKAVSPAQ